ncbi:MAG TPA: TIM-barrel domain-containing protein [Sphingomicrobium sp.]|nr:TIM-barrel domain-containing protein [Sphingomicrobium sp.]
MTAASPRLLLAALMLTTSGAALAGSYTKSASGIVVLPDAGPAKAVRLELYGDRIIRVTESPSGTFDLPPSLAVAALPSSVEFTVLERAGTVILKTKRAQASVSLADGTVRFDDAAGQLDLAETAPGSFAPVTIEGHPYFAIRQQFNRGTDEGLYGLGQHQNRQMNYNGEDVELAQHNMDVAIPFLVSTRNYGVLWDNNSITRFGNPRPYSFAGSGDTTLKVTDAQGRPGWTAQYFLGERLAAERTETVIDYQYLDDQAKWPAAAKAQTVAATTGQNTQGNAVQTQHVVWTGRVTPGATGLHRFRLYSSSYVKVFADGKEVLERWRQNWNPWYHNFDLPLTAGQPVDIRIEWEPNAGYIALLHNDPLADADRHSIQFASEAAKAIDYYYVGGDSMDDVVSGYRTLTGKAPILPKWAYGFWQSRQRYETQNQLLSVVREYRKRKLPLDNIVQDWFYWPEDQWGCHCFDPKRFPDAQAMIDEVHRQNAHVMISVWAKFYPTAEHYKQLDALGGIYRRMDHPRADEPTDPAYLKTFYRDWVGPGYASAFYDPYNRAARDLYWTQIRDSLASKSFDAWWLDSDEPDFHSNLSIDERKRRMSPTAAGPGAAFFNSYPIVHVDGVHQGLIAYKPDVRPFILTRSAFAGIQRDSAAVWSGDVAARWDDLRDQISAGANFSLSGVPNWTHDIGGFAVEERYSKQDPKALDEWRELNTRWFQFGAFSPLFRSHGEFPRREIYELSHEGSPTYESMAWYDRLRYRLMPYIYTLGADTWFRDGTIMRALVMDFGADRNTWAIDDEYLFGPAFLVAPVTEYKARARKVYLPAGATWYDFYSGRSTEGGQTIDAAASYERMPLFVRAGSIVPTGPAIQHTGEDKGGPVTLNVYTGADGGFSLYEDDGTSRQYLHGQYSRIPLKWDEAAKTLTIGAREGNGYAGMPDKRVIDIRWMKPGTARALSFDARPDASVTYTGAPVTVSMK